jgi:predicted solute-binding protein
VKTNWILTALAGLIGLAVAVNGKVMSVDVYAAEALFRKL